MSEPTKSELVFNASPLSVVGGAVFVLVVTVLSILAWRRSGWRGSIGALEMLRILIAIAIAITFNQPAWHETFEPDNKPVLAILHDVSGSMETKDVIAEDEGQSEARARSELVAPLISPELWAPLSERLDTVIEPFSSSEDPPEEGTDLHAALKRLMERYPRLAAVVLPTDGDWNMGKAPAEAATFLRMRGIPVVAVLTGSETRIPDIEITSFDVPTFAVAGKPLRIPFSVTSALPRDETISVTMTASTGEEVTQQFVLPAMGKLQDALTWRPGKPEEIGLTLKIPQTGSERNLSNNKAEAKLDVRLEELRVLVIETFPRWEYRYLRNALQRDPGVDVSTLLFHPDVDKLGAGLDYLEEFPSNEDLATYDVILLGDVGVDQKQLTPPQCTAIMQTVRDQAAGLIFMPGFRGNTGSLKGTDLEDLLPVVWDEARPRGYGSVNPGRFALTEAGMQSLLTKLEDNEDANTRVWSLLPGFQWFAPALRARAGSEVLAVHGTESNRFGRVPLIVTRTYGAGKILYMGADAAWRWRRGVEDKYHYRFWGQVARWMAYQRNMAQGEKMRLFFSPDRPRTRRILTLNANVMSLTGEPLREGAVVAQIVAPSGKVSSVRLLPAGEESWGLFTGNFTPSEPGDYKINLSCAEAGAAMETTITVQGTRREKRGQPARPDVLREIALLTRGAVAESGDPASVVALVNALPDEELIERQIQIWAHPIWAGLLVLLLTIFWIGRKAAGTF